MQDTMQENEIRPGEVATTPPVATDAGLVYIGRIRTPWKSREETPRQGRRDGPTCEIELFEPWLPVLAGIDDFEQLEILYWLHLSRRDLLLQSPADDGKTRGTFSIRSPIRPNPIGTSVVTLIQREGRFLLVRGLDCLDGTPLIDLKPERHGFQPVKNAHGVPCAEPLAAGG